MSAALVRGCALFAVWLVLAGPDPFGLPFGLSAAALGAWASLSLLPAVPGRFNPRVAARLAGGTLHQGVAAGWDIALRALSREPRLMPGIVTVPVTLAPGGAQDALRLLTSLAPGTLPLELGDGRSLILHVLDTGMPHADDIAATEAALYLATGARHG
jgi:multisubunit Na+/H+ antiporter MnhE subunit